MNAPGVLLLIYLLLLLIQTHIILLLASSNPIQSLGTYNETSTQWWYEDTDFVEPTDAELGVTDELQSRFASFAKTGIPNNK